jgi:multiple sugar transport system ATP-binding protein
VGQIIYSGVTKHFDDVVAVDHLDLSVADGELMVLLGPSGCGKTTALRLVAGLEEVDEGTITIGDKVVNDIEPKDRDVAMVFQTYALYPHLTVAKNIEFPLRQRGMAREERLRRVHEVATTLGIDTYLDRKPGQLSGGQRQRVALARAIVRQPEAFLMDEPLSNLDAALRVQTRADIVALQARLGTTTLYVTHDQVEAMTMGDRIAVISTGVLQQVAPPQELYDRPGNTFVAGFLGSPGMNLMNGVFEPDTAATEPSGGRSAAASRVRASRVGRNGTGAVCRPSSSKSYIPSAAASPAGVRPEALAVDPAGSLAASVLIVEALGAEAHVICTLPDGTHLVVRQEADQPRPGLGEAVRISVNPAGVHLFDGASGLRLEPAS